MTGAYRWAGQETLASGRREPRADRTVYLTGNIPVEAPCRICADDMETGHSVGAAATDRQHQRHRMCHSRRQVGVLSRTTPIVSLIVNGNFPPTAAIIHISAWTAGASSWSRCRWDDRGHVNLGDGPPAEAMPSCQRCKLSSGRVTLRPLWSDDREPTQISHRHQESTFLRKRYVKPCTSRFRGNVGLRIHLG